MTAVCSVEFGALEPEQQALVDGHPLRALGTTRRVDTDGVVVEFLVGDDEHPEAVYDDIRGWAIGNRLPIRRLVD